MICANTCKPACPNCLLTEGETTKVQKERQTSGEQSKQAQVEERTVGTTSDDRALVRQDEDEEEASEEQSKQAQVVGTTSDDGALVRQDEDEEVATEEQSKVVRQEEADMLQWKNRALNSIYTPVDSGSAGSKLLLIDNVTYALERRGDKSYFPKAQIPVYMRLKWESHCLYTGASIEKNGVKVTVLIGFTVSSALEALIIHALAFDLKTQSCREMEMSLADFATDIHEVKNFSEINPNALKAFKTRIKTYTFNTRTSSRKAMKTAFLTLESPKRKQEMLPPAAGIVCIKLI